MLAAATRGVRSSLSLLACGVTGDIHAAFVSWASCIVAFAAWRSLCCCRVALQAWCDFPRCKCPTALIVGAAVHRLQSLHMLLTPEVCGLTRGTPGFNALAEELLRKARLLHSLRHENIVQLRGVTVHPEHDHVQWLVTEQANGGSLEAWVSARGRLARWQSCWTCCAASCERWCTCTAATPSSFTATSSRRTC